MMIASFSMVGTLALVPALAMMLGANVGTTLIAQFAMVDTRLLVPMLLLGGLFAGNKSGSLVAREVGKALFGLGLMLLSLRLLQATMQPVEHSALLRSLMSSLSGDPLVALLLAAALAWALHSSLAAVLLVMSMGSAGVIASGTLLAMVFGCNLGSAINPLVHAWAGDAAARRLPLGNLINRLVGCAAGLLLLPYLAQGLDAVGLDPATGAALAHFLFNLALALLFLPVLPVMADGLERLLPERVRAGDPAQPLYLDQQALDTPAVALANATREVLRMADVVETMLRPVRRRLRARRLPQSQRNLRPGQRPRQSLQPDPALCRRDPIRILDDERRRTIDRVA